MAGWVLGVDHPHIVWLADQRSEKDLQSRRTLPHATETKLATIMTSGGVQRLLAVPDQIMASADAPGCARKDEVGRAQHAVLLALKLSHPGLTERQGVELDLGVDIRVVEGRQCLVLWPITEDSPAVAEPMDPRDVARLDALRAIRRRVGLESPLLYPRRQDVFRQDAAQPADDATCESGPACRRVNAVLQGLYLEIRTFTGLTLDFQDLKDLVVRVWLEAGIEPFIVARRSGYKHVRSLVKRMSVFFKAKGGA